MLAAGNDGEEGMFLSSAAASGTDVTAVGSVENTFVPQVMNAGHWSSGNQSAAGFGYHIGFGNFGNTSLPMWADTYDTRVVDDGCHGFSANLTGKIALIRRGGCVFDTKVTSAINAGALYVMFYNNVPGTIVAVVDNISLQGAGMVDRDVGATWINLLAAGKEVTLSFNSEDGLSIVSPGILNSLAGGHMNSFSTWGLTNENAITPVVSAPGGYILSTYLTSGGGYIVMSGTSMATPFIAGVVALYLQAKGKGIRPSDINAALATTATPLLYNDERETFDFLAPVPQQGGKFSPLS